MCNILYHKIFPCVLLKHPQIEDLKYALQESAKLNRVYEKSLKSMCKKYSLQYPGVVNGKSPKSESFVKENLPKEDPGSWQR